jgi:DNA polymerase-4
LEKPDGFVVIREGEAEALLLDLPVGRLWGVGKVAQAALERIGIRTIRDLREAPIESVRRQFGASTEHLLRLARGEDDREVEPGGEAKSIGAETTFAADVADAGELRRTLDALADRVAGRLRKTGCQARTIHLKARFPDFSTVTRAITLPAPASATATIRRAARELFEKKLDRGGRALRLIGVSATQLAKPGEGQLELFSDANEAKAETLDRVVDRLKEKHGGGSIGQGLSGGAREDAKKGKR